MRRFKDVNYYSVLGVLSSASRTEIKAAYRAAVRTAHPDAGGDHDSFALVSEAWEILGDPATRSHYDADRRLTARASRPYTARLDRDVEPDGAEADRPGRERAGAARRPAGDPDGGTDAERWLRNKRRF